MTNQQRAEWDSIVSRGAWEQCHQRPVRRTLPRLNRDVLGIIASFAMHESDVAHMVQVWRGDVEPRSRRRVLLRRLDESNMSYKYLVRDHAGKDKVFDESTIDTLRHRRDVKERAWFIEDNSLPNLAVQLIQQRSPFGWKFDHRLHPFFGGDASISRYPTMSILESYDWTKRMIAAEYANQLAAVQRVPRKQLAPRDPLVWMILKTTNLCGCDFCMCRPHANKTRVLLPCPVPPAHTCVAPLPIRHFNRGDILGWRSRMPLEGFLCRDIQPRQPQNKDRKNDQHSADVSIVVGRTRKR